MLFRHKLVPTKNPVISLGGRWVRPRMLVQVTLVGPAGAQADQAMLDSGADDTVFPEQVAHKLGIDLQQAPVGEAAGVTGTPLPVRYAQATLRLTDGKEFRTWPAWIGFTPIALRQPLLGFAGVLQYFTTTIQGDMETFEMTINRLYPGT